MNLIIKDERFSKLIKSLQPSAQTVENDKLCLIGLCYLIDVYFLTLGGVTVPKISPLISSQTSSRQISGRGSSLSAFTLVKTQGRASDVMSQISPFE